MRRTRQWTWLEIDRFEYKRPFFNWGLRIHLCNGVVVSVPGLEWRRACYGPIAEAWVDELNRRTEARRAQANQ